jgi:hypothetical protein
MKMLVYLGGSCNENIGILYGHFAYFEVILSIFLVLVCCTMKNLAILFCLNGRNVRQASRNEMNRLKKYFLNLRFVTSRLCSNNLAQAEKWLLREGCFAPVLTTNENRISFVPILGWHQGLFAQNTIFRVRLRPILNFTPRGKL